MKKVYIFFIIYGILLLIKLNIQEEMIFFFDDNEVIIKDWNKIRFSSDVFIPNDVSINFYSLAIVINYVIEKMMNLFQKFILMKDILQKYSIK